MEQDPRTGSHNLTDTFKFSQENIERTNRAYVNGVISEPEFNVKVREEMDRLQGVILRGFGLEEPLS